MYNWLQFNAFLLPKTTLTFHLFLDINECDYPQRFPCYGTCANIAGNYTCKCKHGRVGDAKIQDGCRRKRIHPLVIYIGNFSLFSLIVG